MGEIVYLKDVREEKKRRDDLSDRMAECLAERGLDGCYCCSELGECEIHKAMIQEKIDG